jgi:hypothetical protein
MNRKQWEEEQSVLAEVSSSFPQFLSGTRFVPVTSDPPDFVGKDDNGSIIGLELTSWQNGEQVNAAEGRERMRLDLLKIAKWAEHPRPSNVSSVIIVPRWGKRIRASDVPTFREEFYKMIVDIDSRWSILRSQHWQRLFAEQRFDFSDHSDSFQFFWATPIP